MKKLILSVHVSRFFRAWLPILLTLCLCSCAPSLSVPDYRLSGFTCVAVWQEADLSLQATITVSPLKEPTEHSGTDPIPKRDLSICFLSPNSLAGITVCRKDGEISVLLEDMILDDISPSSWLSVEELLLPDGIFSPLSLITEDAKTVLYAQIHQEESDTVYELYLDPSTGIPKRICQGNRSVNIQTFTLLP